MAHGGARKGAGRKTGVKIPKLSDYFTDGEIAAYAKELRKRAKKSDRIAVFLGEHIWGKALQPIGGPDGGPIQIQGVEISVRK